MIKARAQGPNGPVVILGLSFENVNRMKEGQPVQVFGEEVGLNADIIIHVDKDESTIMRILRKAGLNLPEPTKGVFKCPDCAEPLKMVDTDDTGAKYAVCPKCDRQFGVSN